jgi:hypothetical protein
MAVATAVDVAGRGWRVGSGNGVLAATTVVGGRLAPPAEMAGCKLARGSCASGALRPQLARMMINSRREAIAGGRRRNGLCLSGVMVFSSRYLVFKINLTGFEVFLNLSGFLPGSR